MKNSITFLFLICSLVLFSQNITDKNKKKQGKWEVQFEDGSIKYYGIFKDGVEQGLFKFYYNSGELKATKEFFHNGEAAATHIFYKNGNIRASGLYVNTLKDSTWNYFSKDSILVLSEQYKGGELNGVRKTYYESGEIYIIKQWENGVEHGKFVQYYINGQVNLKTNNQNGVFNGEYISYNSDGTVFYSGFYNKGLRDREWRYFNNGVLDTIIYE